MPTFNNKTAKQLAEEYGYAYSFLKSYPSLWATFKKAVTGSWTSEKFAAEVKGTTWYKQNADSARAYDYLKSTDSASYTQQRSQMVAQIKDKASSLGASVSGATLTRIAENAMKFSWNDSQIQDTLSQYVKVSHGIYKGTTGDDLEQVQATAYKNGINVSKATLANWGKSIASGNTSAETLERSVRNMAKSLAPGYAKELDAGMDLSDIVSPYVESKAKILEMNPADIDMFDPDIRKAVSGVGKDGKPTSQSLWQFEQDMRSKPEWLKTQNAQDSVMSTAKKVLTDFGFQGVG